MASETDKGGVDERLRIIDEALNGLLLKDRLAEARLEIDANLKALRKYVDDNGKAVEEFNAQSTRTGNVLTEISQTLRNIDSTLAKLEADETLKHSVLMELWKKLKEG